MTIAKTAATQTAVLALELGLTDSAQKEIIQKHLVAMLAMERERCAAYHDDLAAQHDACEYESDYHVMMARSHRTFAAAIRRGAE